MTAITAGGVLLIIGALFTFKGDIFKAVGAYCLADFCWLYNAYQSDDDLGAVMTAIGLLLGTLAFLKMKFGLFHKSINKQ